ncbi:MAG: DNA primase [Synergistaceae bacterium]|jgi:DNA primase|nr:DNA primase [Synergistaceae bacterium]
MQDDASEVKSRTDIIEVIGSYVQLRQSGGSFVGLCPFHSEKTPSFHVSRERQSFHCFGCGKGGDVYSFIMEIEGLGFRETLELLAERVGVELRAWSGERSKPAEKLGVREALEEAKNFFSESLSGPGGSSARAYLSRRNISGDDVSRFGLGWAPQSWDALARRLSSRGFSEEAILDAGLSAHGDRGLYDRFRGRITFPVNDENGRVVAFGGRLLDGDGAKYINSPEGSLFNKRRTLYLMDAAKRAIRERGRVVLVEGYMDAIRAHMAGFTETVASLGTSLTEEQASLIKRFSDLCCISYDADGAGQAAAIRGMYILQRHGVDVRVVTLPEGLDPDDVLSSDGGIGTFEASLAKSMPLPLYHAHIKKRDFTSPEHARAAKDEVLSGLASLAAFDVDEYIPRIARVFGMLEHNLRREIDVRRAERGMSGIMRNKKSETYDKGISDSPGVYIYEGVTVRDRRSADLECAFCALLWRDEKLRSRWTCGELVPFFSDEAALGIVTALVCGDDPGEIESRWRQIGERLSFECLARGDAVLSAGNLGAEHAAVVVEDIRRNAMNRRLEHIQPVVIRGEADAGLVAEYHDLIKKLKSPGRFGVF